VFLLSALVFLAAEVAAFVAVSAQIGFGWALLILVGVSALGPFVVRRAGLGVVARAQARLTAGDLPTRELLDGVVVLAGGLMICVPGFISDALGLLLMIRPLRHLTILAGGRWLGHRVETVRPGRRTVIDVESQPTGPNAPTPISVPSQMIEPGKRVEG
jgi:UPF0716 protein FxsA